MTGRDIFEFDCRNCKYLMRQDKLLKPTSKLSKSEYLDVHEHVSSARSEVSDESQTRASTSIFSMRSTSRNSIGDSEIVNIKYVVTVIIARTYIIILLLMRLNLIPDYHIVYKKLT